MRVGAVDRRIDQPAADQAAGDAEAHRDQDQDDRQDSMQDVVDPFVGEYQVDPNGKSEAQNANPQRSGTCIHARIVVYQTVDRR
jgi:hypothetical protein